MTPFQNQNGEPGMTVRTPATDDNDTDEGGTEGSDSNSDVDTLGLGLNWDEEAARGGALMDTTWSLVSTIASCDGDADADSTTTTNNNEGTRNVLVRRLLVLFYSISCIEDEVPQKCLVTLSRQECSLGPQSLTCTHLGFWDSWGQITIIQHAYLWVLVQYVFIIEHFSIINYLTK